MNRISHFEIQQNLFGGPLHVISNNRSYHGKQFLTEQLASEFITQAHFREIKTALVDYYTTVKQLIKNNYIPADNASITAINAIDELLKQIDGKTPEAAGRLVAEDILAFMEHFQCEKRMARVWPSFRQTLNNSIGVVRSFGRTYCADFYN